MVLQGIKVIELADGFAGPFCGMQLADAGAEVIKIESRDGDRTRSLGPMTNGVSHLFLSLNRGKKSVRLDLEDQASRDGARSLIHSADVVIAHFPPGMAKKLGLDYENFKPDHTRLIYGEITDFGAHGPFKDMVGSELAVQAMSGIWRFLGDMSTPEARAGLVEPLRVGSYIGSTWAGLFLLHGILSALFYRRKSGLGQKVTTSLLGSIIAVQNQNWTTHTKPDKWHGFELIGPMAMPDNGVRTRDGFIIPQWTVGDREKVRAFFKDIGINPDDERLKPTFGLGLPRVVKDKPGYDLICQALQRFTKEEASKIINEELRAWCAPLNEYSELVSHPQVEHMGFIINVEHPQGGEFKTIGFPILLADTPCQPAGKPPLLGEHTDEIFKQLEPAATNVSVETPLESTKHAGDEKESMAVGSSFEGPGPLKGLKVIDFTGFAVGPWGGSLLGLLGAYVIKIDPISGDGILMREPTQNGVPTPYLAFNQGKTECLGLNLKDSEDKEIAMSLVREADVLIENFRPGVIKRLGFGYEEVSAINPGLIFCSASGYGQSGPLAHWGSADHLSQAFTGYASLNGSRSGEAELLRFYSTNDLTTSISIVSGVLMGLIVRESTGKGQWVQTSMLGASMHLQTVRFAEFFATGSNPRRSGSALPNVVPDQAFQTGSGFIAVSATNHQEWVNLCQALDVSELSSDPRFATAEDRVKNREELVKILQEKFARLPTWWWLTQLNRNKVPCGLYLTLEEIMHHVHFSENNFIVEVNLPLAGRIKIAGPPYQFSRTPAKIVKPALCVIPQNHNPFFDYTEYPNGFPGEHTGAIKERFRSGKPLFPGSHD